jgi:glutamate synthase (NADPH/NADH) small chain
MSHPSHESSSAPSRGASRSSPSRLRTHRLEERFADKHPLYSDGEAAAEAARCLYCFDAPCMHACPTHIDIAGFIKKIASGNLTGSAKTILSANLLGSSCAKVCPVEVLCEGACVYVGWGRKAISIGRLQNYAMEHGGSAQLFERKPSTGRSIALVGAGPASLACAGTLALQGHRAILFEKEKFPGGLNTSGVAPYKMNARAALEEIDFIRELGVEIRTGIEIGRDVKGRELLKEHDFVFLGPGLGPDTPLDVPGSDGPGVVGAVAWIARMKLDPKLSIDGVRRAAVIGGGNTALDAARELVQLGVPDVKLVYRRGEAEMSGYRHEWDEAKKEGVVLVPNAIVRAVVREGAAFAGRGKLLARAMKHAASAKRGAAKTSAIASGRALASGRVLALDLVRAKKGKPTSNELGHLLVDLVIVAIGQSKLAALAREFPGVKVDDSGCFVADPATGRTGNARVFTGGDAMNGGKEVVNAAAEGQNAARAMDSLLLSKRRAPVDASVAARLAKNGS